MNTKYHFGEWVFYHQTCQHYGHVQSDQVKFGGRAVHVWDANNLSEKNLKLKLKSNSGLSYFQMHILSKGYNLWIELHLKLFVLNILWVINELNIAKQILISMLLKMLVKNHINETSLIRSISPTSGINGQVWKCEWFQHNIKFK